MLPPPHLTPLFPRHGLSMSFVLGRCSGYLTRGAAPQLPPAHTSPEPGRAVEMQAQAKVYLRGSKGRM